VRAGLAPLGRQVPRPPDRDTFAAPVTAPAEWIRSGRVSGAFRGLAARITLSMPRDRRT
jgi:hypothetical protein